MKKAFLDDLTQVLEDHGYELVSVESDPPQNLAEALVTMNHLNTLVFMKTEKSNDDSPESKPDGGK